MSLLWVTAQVVDEDHPDYDRYHQHHKMHQVFRDSGIRDSPCANIDCQDFHQGYSDAFDRAEQSHFNGQGKHVLLPLDQPLHGYENHISAETEHGLPPDKGSGPPQVFRWQGQHHIMDGHNRLSRALREGQSHYPVILHDVDGAA